MSRSAPMVNTFYRSSQPTMDLEGSCDLWCFPNTTWRIFLTLVNMIRIFFCSNIHKHYEKKKKLAKSSQHCLKKKILARCLSVGGDLGLFSQWLGARISVSEVVFCSFSVTVTGWSRDLGTPFSVIHEYLHEAVITQSNPYWIVVFVIPSQSIFIKYLEWLNISNVLNTALYHSEKRLHKVIKAG